MRAQLCEKWCDAESILAITNYMASSHILGTSALRLTSMLPIKLLSVLQYISMMRAVNALGKAFTAPPAALGFSLFMLRPYSLTQPGLCLQSSYAPVFVVAQVVHLKKKQTSSGRCRLTSFVLKDLHNVT